MGKISFCLKFTHSSVGRMCLLQVPKRMSVIHHKSMSSLVASDFHYASATRPTNMRGRHPSPQGLLCENIFDHLFKVHRYAHRYACLAAWKPSELSLIAWDDRSANGGQHQRNEPTFHPHHWRLHHEANASDTHGLHRRPSTVGRARPLYHSFFTLWG